MVGSLDILFLTVPQIHVLVIQRNLMTKLANFLMSKSEDATRDTRPE